MIQNIFVDGWASIRKTESDIDTACSTSLYNQMVPNLPNWAFKLHLTDQQELIWHTTNFKCHWNLHSFWRGGGGGGVEARGGEAVGGGLRVCHVCKKWKTEKQPLSCAALVATEAVWIAWRASLQTRAKNNHQLSALGPRRGREGAEGGISLGN